MQSCRNGLKYSTVDVPWFFVPLPSTLGAHNLTSGPRVLGYLFPLTYQGSNTSSGEKSSSVNVIEEQAVRSKLSKAILQIIVIRYCAFNRSRRFVRREYLTAEQIFSRILLKVAIFRRFSYTFVLSSPYLSIVLVAQSETFTLVRLKLKSLFFKSYYSSKGLIYESAPPPPPAPSPKGTHSDAGKQAPVTSEDEDEFGSWSEKNNVSEDGFIPKC